MAVRLVSPFANALTDADRFWSKVDRTDDCWYWKGTIDGHGYGKLSVGGEIMRAHHVAWFFVMGEWPKEQLYQRHPKPASHWSVRSGMVRAKFSAEDRLCVRPHHFREGNPDAALRRWSPDAQAGFPPEFRSIVDKLVSTEQAETDLMPLLLFRGALTVGRAQALFNFTMAAQAAEAQRLGDVIEMSKTWPDVAHAVGLHKPITTNQTIVQFWGRVLSDPKVRALRPGMREYIQATLANSNARPIFLEPISEQSRWSTRRWRSGRRSMDDIQRAAATRRELREADRLERAGERARAAVIRQRAQEIAKTPLSEVWPFIPVVPTNEHDLILAVDAVVPKGFPEWLRQDVCQDLILAVFEEQVTLDNLRDAAPEYIKHVFRMYPSKYGPLSLDAALTDDGASLMDTLAGAPVILGGEETMTLAALRDLLRAEEAVA